ncbi:hypothetical protein SAMN05192545_3081 [Maribacter dokdonensis]|uniref:Uncharacterized protein n=1 Tax=Maribacter dokdonensis TaxID=320912 RepID=A0ABY0UV80_9FLAO|nr:hypothetical protein [Maribacter dokdonensis]SDT22540.1 hypothetical protein SAMN05192545_3081 [Maribacter dokdonensis]
MVTYKERKENQQNFILIKDHVPLGTFGSLKKVVDYLENEKCPSYWTLVRKTENPIEFGDFKVYKVKHY